VGRGGGIVVDDRGIESVGNSDAFRFNRFSAVGIMICMVMTLSVLLSQSRNILFGRSTSDQERLRQQLLRIKQQGESHPLWRWLYGTSTSLSPPKDH
jgi:hypothetical protein